MASLLLSFRSGKLVVTGRTFDLKDRLKSLGGRWYPELQGWSFASDSKRRVFKELRACKGVANIEDAAKVTLLLEGCDEGHRVLGDTYPVRELLKEMGGRWESQPAGWLFPTTLQAERLISTLVASGDVERVERAQKALAASASDAQPSADHETPDRKRSGTNRGSTAAAIASGSLGKNGAEKRGAVVATKGAAKGPGADVETRSVTKKPKVVETIVEKATPTAVTVRRLRSGGLQRSTHLYHARTQHGTASCLRANAPRIVKRVRRG